MTGIFGKLSPGEPGLRTDKGSLAEDAHTIDVPVIGTPERRTCFNGVSTMDRTAIRNRLRAMQLLLSIGALAFIRPQYNEGPQWITLFTLCHTFVVSFVLLWDRRCCGTIVRSLLPLVDWRLLELVYTAATTLALYILSYSVMFAHKGYYSTNTFNWVSCVLTLLTALCYGAETWVQLRDKYDGRTGVGQ